MIANKALFLHLEPHMLDADSGVTIEIKLQDEGVVVDAWSLDDCIESTWETYSDLGVEVREIEDE